MSLCYHNRKGCPFCGDWHRRDPMRNVRRKPRCVTCGRFTKRVETCARCVTSGFEAIPLFAA